MMLKTIERILLILALAALISGTLYLLVNGSNPSSASPFRQDVIGERLSRGRSAGLAVEGDGFPGGRGGHGFEGRGDRGLPDFEPSIAVFGILRNLSVIALITLVVGLSQKTWYKVFRRKNFTPSG